MNISNLVRILFTFCCSKYLTDNSDLIPEIPNNLCSKVFSITDKQHIYCYDDEPLHLKKCADNEEYNDCGIACPLTCDNFLKPPRICGRKCISGCFCKVGFVRDKNSGKCIKPDHCENNICGQNATFKSCGRECSFCDTDGNLLIRSPCNDCISGCFCNDNYIRDMRTNNCINANQCF